MQEPDDASPLLDELKDKKLRAMNTIERCKKALKAIDTYIDKLVVEHLDISKLGEAMDIYDSTEEGWEDKIILLNKEIVSLDKKIEEEESRLRKQVGSKKLRTQVMVGLYAELAGEVEITVIYGASLFSAIILL
jgi:predicted  nucleic acid-binding Zn-ribbon protein